MNKLMQLQALGNCCLSIIGFSSFIILANYIRLTKSSCSYISYSCTSYHSFQTNAAFSFFLIFAPWIGMIGALKGKVFKQNYLYFSQKILVFIYLTIIAIILLVYLITCIIILSNSDVRSLWKIARHTDSIDISAALDGFMASFNMLIAQIVLVWFFLVGTGIITFGAVKKQEDEGGISEPLA